jgi:hypothetical protein
LHLLATLSDVRMHPAGPLELAAEQAVELAERLTRTFAGEGFALHAAGTQLLAHFGDELDVQTTDPAPLAGRRIDVQLPRGRDGGRLRRRMTELQMALYETPVPGADDRLQPNALWCWGGGREPLAGRAAWPHVESDDPFVGALHRLDGARVDRTEARLVTWRLASLGHHGDAFAAADREWFAALEAALAGGRLRLAVLHFAGRAYVLRPSQRWRFWARPRPWWELAA